ncbi:hypothetical protein CBR_g25808 [Chara braunii]|uniref:Uncharacterized protein n=1 Tax=Chara braunii TaxID=69332 RepID=A0A388L6E5_CHABU|nr:hypothetical protein CBR_g25808 [Chara braunii]|eukprot:GBG77876.1 hypothetical protein CBR_g25808 [Chara braunii]
MASTVVAAIAMAAMAMAAMAIAMVAIAMEAIAIAMGALTIAMTVIAMALAIAIAMTLAIAIAMGDGQHCGGSDRDVKRYNGQRCDDSNSDGSAAITVIALHRDGDELSASMAMVHGEGGNGLRTWYIQRR